MPQIPSIHQCNVESPNKPLYTALEKVSLQRNMDRLLATKTISPLIQDQKLNFQNVNHYLVEEICLRPTQRNKHQSLEFNHLLFFGNPIVASDIVCIPFLGSQ